MADGDSSIESSGKGSPKVAERYVVRHIHDGRIFYAAGALDDGAECSGTAGAQSFESEASAQATADRLNVVVPQYSWHPISVPLADADDALNNAAWAARDAS